MSGNVSGFFLEILVKWALQLIIYMKKVKRNIKLVEVTSMQP